MTVMEHDRHEGKHRSQPLWDILCHRYHPTATPSSQENDHQRTVATLASQENSHQRRPRGNGSVNVSCTDWHLLFTGSTRIGAARILAITLPIVAAIVACAVIGLCLWRKKSKPAQKATVPCKSIQSFLSQIE
jgi:hypothetical protein